MKALVLSGISQGPWREGRGGSRGGESPKDAVMGGDTRQPGDRDGEMKEGSSKGSQSANVETLFHASRRQGVPDDIPGP